MSDQPPVGDSEQEKGLDPSLDITSEHFDPLKALYSENVYIPYKNAKVYDNIWKYESDVIGNKSTNNVVAKTSNQSTDSKTVLPNTQTNTARVNDEPVVRRFLPHQRKSFLFS